MSVCHFYHGVADHLISNAETGLKYLGYNILAQVFVLNMHHCVMQQRIKGLPQGGNLLNAQLFQNCLELLHGHQNTLGIGLVNGLLTEGPGKIVVYRKKRRCGLRFSGIPGMFPLPLTALAVVVILRQQPNVLLLLSQESCINAFRGRQGLLDGRFLPLGRRLRFRFRLRFCLRF